MMNPKIFKVDHNTLLMLLVLVSCCLLISGCDSQAAKSDMTPEKAAEPALVEAVEPGGMVQWLEPAVEVPAVRSEEEKQQGMQLGRPTPTPEFLQPPLDKSLPQFTPGLDPNIRAEFKGGASDIMPGLVLGWLEAFQEFYPTVSIEIATPYAGSLGMLEVIEGTYDFVFVSRELKPTDISSFNDRYGYDPLIVPVSGGAYRHYGFLDAIGFFVHPENPIDRLSFEQIDALYSSTHLRSGKSISTWGELGLGGDWANKPVHLYGIAPWNGFEEFIRQKILSTTDSRGEWREGIEFTPHAFHVAEQVANDPLGVGYTGLAYLNWPVKVLPLSAGAELEYTAPSYENVAKASYPLSRMMYFSTNRVPTEPLQPVFDELMRFILSAQGQQILLDQAIYLPLRGWQAEEALSLLASSPDQAMTNEN